MRVLQPEAINIQSRVAVQHSTQVDPEESTENPKTRSQSDDGSPTFRDCRMVMYLKLGSTCSFILSRPFNFDNVGQEHLVEPIF